MLGTKGSPKGHGPEGQGPGRQEIQGPKVQWVRVQGVRSQSGKGQGVRVQGQGPGIRQNGKKNKQIVAHFYTFFAQFSIILPLFSTNNYFGLVSSCLEALMGSP